MSSSFITSRLAELNEQLMTISKLQSMEDESLCVKDRKNIKNKPCKPCPCTHHIQSQKEHDKIPTKDVTTKSERDTKIADSPHQDKNNFERFQKDLLNERKRTKELEEKLESLTCSLRSIKEDGEQRVNCLKDKLMQAEEKVKLAIASKTIAMNLVNQSNEQLHVISVERDKLLNQSTSLQEQISTATHNNTALKQECDNLKCKLQMVSEDENNRYTELMEEVNKIKCAIKQKEEALITEKKELIGIISELTNLIKIEKKKISELTCICNKQQRTLREKNKQLSEKDTELSNVQHILESNNCKCKKLEEEMENFKYCLDDRTKANNRLTEEMERLKSTHYCELKIKEKIVEEQNATISRQKKLLQESQNLATQVAHEFDEVKQELCKEQQRNRSLEIVLHQAEAQLKNTHLMQCSQCETLKSRIKFFAQENKKATAAAKFALQKLHESKNEYQKQIDCVTRQHRFITLILQKKEEEIRCLKKEILHSNSDDTTIYQL